ncbi:unnamed protein product [Klebsiella pneumoniae subsp. rhinoscleromatis SB3432]|nr:unnamed protein product [Klebsiella pneumoniae subsp. rhinoscleromatis SB3432]STT67115.1 triosephosphate isomerase [Klebsiella pneumoniae]STU45224.1 triosephosphate isomerase [Klebsiella pneumoniae]STV44546.1 triosephosphate isomerase [Klebsiella pneumoniae subsp. rhinoscleromatis]VTT32769.1 triosephosphate isomerase [Klebsiella pneumoniae]
MMTPIWLGTSWKMNKPLSQAMAWCETLAARMPEGCHPRYSALRHSPLHRDPTRQPFSANASVTASDRRAEYA